ncbi:MAG: autotransporter domain-containing protein, partial [Hyphomicrobiales bacterium]
PIGGAGGLVKSGTGVLTLSGTNSYSGGTTILGGVLALAADANLGAASGLTIDGGTLRAIGSFSSARSVVFNSGGATIDTGVSAPKAVEPTTVAGGVTLSLTGPITGAGGLTLIGSGTLVLSNASYSGPTSLLAAGVTLKGGATDGFSADSAVTIGAGALLDLGGFDQAIGSLAGAGTVSNSGAGKAMLSAGADNASTLFSGVVKDDGPTGLVKAGTGTLTLTGASTYTGGTMISAGTLQLGNGGTSGSIAGNVTDNGVLAFDRSDSATFAGAISGTGSLQQIGTGKTILTGASTYTGATIVSAGTLQGGAVNGFAPMSAFTIAGGGVLDLGGFNETIGSLAGFGTVTNSGNGQATLTVGGNNASTLFGGLIRDDGATGLVKIGAGTLTLTGVNTYSGATTVVGGVLDVEGSIANSAVTVESGATIAGKGTLGSLIVPAGAIAAPGAVTPLTTLIVAKDAVFAAGSTFLVNVDAAGRNDKLSVGGKATLQGGTVQVEVAPGIYLPGSRYVLLAANGGVTGTFANLATSTDLAFLTPTLSYDANDAFFGFVRSVTTSGDVVTFPSVALTRNQASAAAGVQLLGLGSPLYDAVLNQNVAGARQAFDALSGEVHASAATAALEDSRLPRQAILGRLAESTTPALGAATAMTGAYAADLPGRQPALAPISARFASPRSYDLWGQGFGNWGTTHGDGNAATLGRSTEGFILGADVTRAAGWSGVWRLGVAAGFTDDRIKLNARLSSGELEGVFGSLYGGTSFGALDLRAGLALATNTTRTSRSVLFPMFNDATSANYGGSTAQAFGEAGYRIALSGLGLPPAELEPVIGAAAIHLRQDGFAEDGGNAALTGLGRGYDLATTTIGLRAKTVLSEAFPLTVRAMIGWQRAYGDVDPTALMAFRGSPAPFSIAGAPIDRNAFLAETGLDYALSPNLTIGASYFGQYGTRAKDSAVKAKLEARF